jgi:hypothetical protein
MQQKPAIVASVRAATIANVLRCSHIGYAAIQFGNMTFNMQICCFKLAASGALDCGKSIKERGWV